jgi:hypothetical protein
LFVGDLFITLIVGRERRNMKTKKVTFEDLQKEIEELKKLVKEQKQIIIYPPIPYIPQQPTYPTNPYPNNPFLPSTWCSSKDINNYKQQ